MVKLSDRIMRRVRGHGRGRWVCTPSDFSDLGSQAAIHKALSILARNGDLRRLSRGYYDLPRYSVVLKKFAPADLDQILDAIRRRDGIRIVPTGIFAANRLGVTNCVPVKADYFTDTVDRKLEIGGSTIRLRRGNPKIMRWVGKPFGVVLLALEWLGPKAIRDPMVVPILRQRLPEHVKQDLQQALGTVPKWMNETISKLIAAE